MSLIESTLTHNMYVKESTGRQILPATHEMHSNHEPVWVGPPVVTSDAGVGDKRAEAKPMYVRSALSWSSWSDVT